MVWLKVCFCEWQFGTTVPLFRCHVSFPVQGRKDAGSAKPCPEALAKDCERDKTKGAKAWICTGLGKSNYGDPLCFLGISIFACGFCSRFVQSCVYSRQFKDGLKPLIWIKFIGVTSRVMMATTRGLHAAAQIKQSSVQISLLDWMVPCIMT